MKLFSRLLVATLLSAATLSAQGPASASQPIKIAFWNLEWFPGGSPNATEAEARKQIAAAIPAIAELNPDILGMEEIKDWAAAETATAKVPGMKVQVCSEFKDDAGLVTKQQQAIASKLPAIGAWWEAWKAGEKITPKRGFSFAAYQPAPGHVLLVYCLHLKSNRGQASENFPMREESIKQMLDHAAAMEKAYGGLGQVTVVAGGDFNTSKDDAKFETEKTLQLMEDGGFVSCWKDVPFPQRITLPSSPPKNPNLKPFPDACFDHAYVKGAKIVSASVPAPHPNPSDHRPVVLSIELPKGNQ